MGSSMLYNSGSSWGRSQQLCPDLFGTLQDLLCGCSGQDGPVAPWAELQAHGQSANQLHPQLCDGHLLIHYCDGLLCQDWVWQWRQHLRDREKKKTRRMKHEWISISPFNKCGCRAIIRGVLVRTITAVLFHDSDATYCIGLLMETFSFPPCSIPGEISSDTSNRRQNCEKKKKKVPRETSSRKYPQEKLATVFDWQASPGCIPSTSFQR